MEMVALSREDAGKAWSRGLPVFLQEKGGDVLEGRIVMEAVPGESVFFATAGRFIEVALGLGQLFVSPKDLPRFRKVGISSF